MPPTGGEGGNSAIRDAALLVKRIRNMVSASNPRSAVGSEIAAYEKEMLKLSWVAVTASYRNCKVMTIEGYILPYFVRLVLRVINFFFGAKST